MEKKEAFNLRLDAEILDGLRRLTARDGIPAAVAIRRATRADLVARGILTDATTARNPTSRKAPKKAR